MYFASLLLMVPYIFMVIVFEQISMINLVPLNWLFLWVAPSWYLKSVIRPVPRLVTKNARIHPKSTPYPYPDGLSTPWRALHVRTCTPRFPDLANGWADRVQIFCVNRDPLDNSFTHVWGGVHLHVRTCTPRFRDLANRWADCVQILCVNKDSVDNCFAHVWCGVHLHVRTCIPLVGTERRIVKLTATRTTNLRSAALPQKRCLTGNRRLVEHRDNNYSLELLFSLWETNLSYRNRALKQQLCWRLGQVEGSLNPRTAGGLSHLRTAGGGGAHRCPPPG